MAKEEDPTHWISDHDRDSMHILPLSILPIETPGLTRARLVKNPALESMVEIFEDEGTGSGQVPVSGLADAFNWPDGHPDEAIMTKLARLPSYDVYSLRISMRELGITVSDRKAFQLSDAKVQELSDYMTAFTHPLMRQLFGEEDSGAGDFTDILSIFRDPDVAKVRRRLIAMAEKLDIPPDKIPLFLEQIGDTFLSISYYRQCLDDLAPVVDGFNGSLGEIQGNRQLSADQGLMQTCETMQRTIGQVQAGMSKRFEVFDQATQDMWKNATAADFRQIRKFSQDSHAVMGRTLCGLSVKMDAWHDRFPSSDAGGPMKRAEFIMQEMRQGLDKMRLKPPKGDGTQRVWS